MAHQTYITQQKAIILWLYIQGSKKVRTSHPEQVVFPAGQVGQVSHLPYLQEHRNINCQLNRKKGTVFTRV